VVLATSREGLAVPGEQIVAVPSLGLPPRGATGDVVGAAASVELFCDRARSVRHDFAPGVATVESIGQLCRRLDGIPLAIELAAARVGSLSPEDLLRRLDQRFRVLTRGGRVALERHQTLRNAIDWSYDLLDESERLALQRLSVFAGGGDLDALEAVLPAGGGLDADDVIDVVSRLVDKSLVVVETGEEGRVRYRMLETIRQYAHERLEASGDIATVRGAHGDYYVTFAQMAGPHLRSRDLPDWAWRVEREADNFRAVIDWAVDTAQPGLAIAVVAQLRGHGHPTGHPATEWADAAIEIPGAEDQPDFLAVASWATFGAAYLRQDFDRANEIAGRIERLQAQRGRTDPAAYQGIATSAVFQNDMVKARDLGEEWVETARASNDGYELSHALLLLASMEQALEEPDAQAHVEEAARVARETGTLSALSIALGLLIYWVDIESDDRERALALLDEAAEVAYAIDDRVASSIAIGNRAILLAAIGDPREALAVATQAAGELGTSTGFATGRALLKAVAIALSRVEQPRAAVMFLGAAENGGGGIVALWLGTRASRLEAGLRDQLGEEFQPLYEQGRALTAAEAWAYLDGLDV
jgi:predicted ATPase